MKRPGAWIPLVLVAGVLAIYGQTLAFDFVVFDDDKYVTGNPTVQRGLSLEGIGWAFDNQAVSAWHPLTWFSHMLDAQLFGDWAGGHHASNVLLHALACVLLFAALRSLTGATWRSAAVAALFAWHPLRVESVAWVSERKDVLSGVFAMLTLWCYARYARSRSPAAWLGAFLSLALGLLAKPTLVPLPCVLLLLDYWPLARRESWPRLLLEKLPFFALSGLASLLTLAFQRRFLMPLTGISPLQRAANAVVAIDSYLRKMVWPNPLAPLYPHPNLPAQGGVPLDELTVLLSALLLVTISLAVWRARRFPPLLVGWLWFLGLLVPTLGIVHVGRQAFADRYTYLPAIGLSIALVWGAAELGSRVRAPALRRLLCAAAALALAGYGLAAQLQTRVWRDSETLLRHTLAVSPRASAMRFNLAGWLYHEDRAEEAIPEYRAALEVDPGNAVLHFDLGRALHSLGRSAEAIEEYRRAAAIEPRNPKYVYQIGLSYEREGRLAEAVEYYRHTVALDPANEKPRKRLASALSRLGRR
ncbi:MAG TPA: tetratricopeptide repeat protein [Myxococcota bacterium]|jgi:tetratricopeptide (TPR) repeat protein